MADGQPTPRRDPADCEIGDWVLACDIPQWSRNQLRQAYAPPGPGLERWTFLGSYYIDAAGEPVAIWRREE